MGNKPTDQEAIEIIRVLKSGGFDTEQEDDEKLNFLIRFWPNMSNLIFHGSDEWTAEDIFEKAKAEKPISL